MGEGYSLSTIKAAWKSYKTDSALRVLRDGIWSIEKPKPGAIRATKAEWVRYEQVIDFPTYLESIFDGS